MKEKILASLEQAGAEITESIEEGDIWGINYKMSSGTCGHVIMKGGSVASKSSYKAATPERLAETLRIEKAAGNL